MTAIASCERPWSYHVNHSEEREYNTPTEAGVQRAAEAIAYIASHPGCNRYDLLRNCKGITSYAQAGHLLNTISNTDCQLYEDDDARLYYGGVR